MSQERSPEAERVLMRIRSSAEPGPAVANRVLAGVEQRIALGAGPAGVGGNAAREISAVVPRVSSGQHVWKVAARLGRWGAFGLVAGAIGYQLGSRANEPAVPRGVTAASVPASASVSSSTAAVAGSAITGGPTMVLPPPAEPAVELATPAPVASSPGAPSGAAGAVAIAARSGSVSPRGVSRASSTRKATGAASTSRAVAQNGAQLELAEVLERLQRAQASLRDGDAHAALDELDALDALEHGGVLVDERLVLRALAFCDIGRVGDARHVLSELERLGAGSIYRGRLEQGCSAALDP